MGLGTAAFYAQQQARLRQSKRPKRPRPFWPKDLVEEYEKVRDLRKEVNLLQDQLLRLKTPTGRSILQSMIGNREAQITAIVLTSRNPEFASHGPPDCL